MEPDTLAAIGRALYGENWITPLAATMGVNKRSIERWLTGYSRIPPDLAGTLIPLIDTRIADLTAIRSTLTSTST